MAAATHPRSVSVDDVMRQLTEERLLRGAAEQTARNLRRDNARLAATTQARSHYVIFIPKPKWSVWRDKFDRLFLAGSSWLRAAYKAARELLWPPED